MRRRRTVGEIPEYRPVLLDQAGTGALSRLAAERLDGRGSTDHSPRLQRAPGRPLLFRVKRVLLPLAMVAIGGLVTASMAFGAVFAATDADGLTRGDSVRIAIIVLLSIMFLGQALTVLQMLPGVAWISARLRHEGIAPAPPQVLLDQVSAAVLARSAPLDLGRASGAALLGARGRWFVDLGSWVFLVLVAMGITLLFLAGSALGAWSGFWHAGFGPASVLRIGFLLVAAFGLVMLAMTGLRALKQRQQRRRKRLLRRLLRFLLRLFDSGRRWATDMAGVSSRNPASTIQRHGTSVFDRLSRVPGSQLGRMFAVAFTVTAIALYPILTGTEASARRDGGSNEQVLIGDEEPLIGGTPTRPTATSIPASLPGQPASPTPITKPTEPSPPTLVPTTTQDDGEATPGSDASDDVIGSPAPVTATATPTANITAPVPTATPALASTTQPTLAPTFTSTPEATPTPQPTSTPEATPTPIATSTPEATPTPEPTSTLEPTSTPEATPTPAETKTPTSTSTPEVRPTSTPTRCTPLPGGPPCP